MDKNEVVPLTDGSFPNRNLSRKRRQPPDMHKGTNRWRRKRRRRHRLLLKTRKHSRNSQDSQSNSNRDKFILKSDGPGQVIFGADKVKKDWCRTIPFNQTITINPRCGVQSCANCKPQRLRWVNVTLSCPGQNPPKIQTTILKVESCRCIASEREDINQKIRGMPGKGRNLAIQLINLIDLLGSDHLIILMPVY
ncbi:bursicon [Caerostris extrusa]|uniref:Bursicon n=1 Tax=Caerostris extrusa TaxID=172846 RepID=A0AAV4PUE8_CAEEX|nr:bursicon [Caerostris extrusa]